MDSMGLVSAVQDVVRVTVGALSGCEVTIFAPPTPAGGGLTVSDLDQAINPVTSGITSVGAIYVTLSNSPSGSLGGTLSGGTIISLDGQIYTVDSTELRGLGVRVYLSTPVSVEIPASTPAIIVDDDFEIGPIDAVEISQKSLHANPSASDASWGVQVSGLDLPIIPKVDWRVVKTDLAGRTTSGVLKCVANPGTVVLLYIGDK